jgi:hypothetical protein
MPPVTQTSSDCGRCDLREHRLNYPAVARRLFF